MYADSKKKVLGGRDKLLACPAAVPIFFKKAIYRESGNVVTVLCCTATLPVFIPGVKEEVVSCMYAHTWSDYWPGISVVWYV